MNNFKEQITCNACSNTIMRDTEIMETSGKFAELESPMKAVVIKRFVCDKCHESDYTIKLIKNDNGKVEKCLKQALN